MPNGADPGGMYTSNGSVGSLMLIGGSLIRLASTALINRYCIEMCRLVHTLVRNTNDVDDSGPTDSVNRTREQLMTLSNHSIGYASSQQTF